MNGRRKLVVGVLGAALGTGASLAAAGVAGAVSGGGYSSAQQGCPWSSADWNTPSGQTYQGCHSAALNVESGGTTDGRPNDGYDNSPNGKRGNGPQNTRWVSVGSNQVPVDSNSQGTPTFYSIGEPGQSGSPHAGCASVNTDGTNPPPPSQTPGSMSSANSYDGCGNNAKGAGFTANYDYYPLYCPLVAMTSVAPAACESYAGSDTGGNPAASNYVTPDTGTQQNLTEIFTQGLIVYFGMDDNSDNGEHDGQGPYSSSVSPKSAGSVFGPSDGGAVLVSVTPQNATKAPSPTNPEGLANASTGFCADGTCGEGTTQRQTVYYGCGANTGEKQSADRCPKGRAGTSRNVYDYSGKQWDPFNCSSGGAQSDASCDTSAANPSPSGSSNPNGGMDYWRQQEAQYVNAEPGVQVYGDPDPQGSPAVPIYPDPSLYAGTCGVEAGGGGISGAGDPTGTLPNQSLGLPAGTPGTNRAGQVGVSTGC